MRYATKPDGWGMWGVWWGVSGARGAKVKPWQNRDEQMDYGRRHGTLSFVKRRPWDIKRLATFSTPPSLTRDIWT